MKILLQTFFWLLLVTQVCFGQWSQVGLNDKSIKDIAAHNSLIFAVTSDSGKLYRSTDEGISWSPIFELGVIDVEISPSGDVFMIKDSVYYYGPKQLFRSMDAGSTWAYLNVMEQMPDNVRVSPTGTIFCSYWVLLPHSANTEIARSTDNGLAWTAVGVGGSAYDFEGSFILTQGYWCGMGTSAPTDLALSTDDGSQWSTLGRWPWAGPSTTTLKLCLNGNILVGGYWWGLILSDDSCSSWTQVSTLKITCGLSIETGGMLVGTDSLGAFLFADNGDSLGASNSGLTNLNIHTLTIDNNNYVYAGIDNGVWRRPLSEIVTSVGKQPTQPTYYMLEQNYPNPFNPSTKIKYSVPQTSQVVIKVFDVLGKEIETLVNEEKPSGTYELNWNATQLSSGIYFYTIQAGEFIDTKKMILLK